MPANSSAVFRGLIREQMQMGGVSDLALATSLAAVNLNSQTVNQGAAAEIYSILAGRTNIRASASATNHANVVLTANPQGFRYLELYHIFENAAATTVSSAPVVHVFGRCQPPQVDPSQRLFPSDVDSTSFPAASLPFSTYGMWIPLFEVGYTPGTPAITLSSASGVIEYFDPAGGSSYTQKLVISEPSYVYVGDVSQIAVLIKTAAAFSGTTVSYIGGRLSSN